VGHTPERWEEWANWDRQDSRDGPKQATPDAAPTGRIEATSATRSETCVNRPRRPIRRRRPSPRCPRSPGSPLTEPCDRPQGFRLIVSDRDFTVARLRASSALRLPSRSSRRCGSISQAAPLATRQELQRLHPEAGEGPARTRRPRPSALVPRPSITRAVHPAVLLGRASSVCAGPSSRPRAGGQPRSRNRRSQRWERGCGE
jgi:hypothetical protein